MMKLLARDLDAQVLRAARAFPAVILTGPRRAGKTSLLRRLLPDAQYFLFESPDIIDRFRSDPRGFLGSITPPAIFDEVQNVPEIFPWIRARIDERPRSRGRWFLTGSQEAPLMRGVTESMAGRAAMLQLLPFSLRESPRVSLLRGGYPEVVARPASAGLWFASYLQTYLERDVRSVTDIRDLALFRRFLAILATRHGQVLNKSDLAAPLGVSVPTITRWLDVLELTAQILVVPPFYENAGKRLIKSPKVFLHDSGLACHLLGIETAAELERSPFLGAVMEGFVGAEIAKAQVHAGRRRELYYFRDQQGLEVDFVVPTGRALRLIEVKSTHTPIPSMAAAMTRLAAALTATRKPSAAIERVLVHRIARGAPRITALAPDTRALPLEEFAAAPLDA